MIILFLVVILIAIAAWNAFYKFHWYKGISVKLNFVQNVVYAGEQANITETIENAKKMPVPIMEVAFHTDKGIIFHDMENTKVSDMIYKKDIFSMLGDQRIIRKLTLDCNKRGLYRIDEISYSSYSMLFRKNYIKKSAVDTRLYVYARRANVSDIVYSCEKMMGVMQCAKKLYDDPFAFSSIREYTPTDPMKTINWKASAKTGGLMVNQYDSTMSQRVMIYLDIEDKGIIKFEHLVEESISLAASLAQRLIRQGMEVGISVNVKDADTNECISYSPAGGNKQLVSIEKMLAMRTQRDETVAFDTILTEIPKETMAVFISKDVERNRQTIESFLGRDEYGVWIIPYDSYNVPNVVSLRNLSVVKREVHE